MNLLFKVIWVFGIFIWSLIALTACDDRPCAEGHYDTTYIPTLVGKTTILMPQQIYVCDRYQDGK